MFFSRPFLIVLLPTLILSIMMTWTAPNWIMIWISMEINIITISPLMMTPCTTQQTEGTIKYFLNQQVASITFFATMIIESSTMILPPTLLQITDYLFIFALLLKLGAAPFHAWFPGVMTSMTWPMCMMIATTQKIIPLGIITNLSQSFTSPLIYAGVLSALMGGWGGMNQADLRALLAYSSINHMGWILASSPVNTTITLFYFTAYMVISLSIMSIFWKLNLKKISQSSTITPLSLPTKTMIISLLLTSSGMPPTMMFFPKMFVLNSLAALNFILPCLGLIAGSLMALFFYLTLSFKVILAPKMFFSSKTTLPLYLMPALFIPMLMTPFTPSILMLLS